MFKKILYLLDNIDRKKILFLVFLMLIATALEVLSIGLIVPFVSILIDGNYIQNSNFIYKYFPIVLKLEQVQIIKYSLVIFIIIFISKLIFMNFLVYIKNNFLFSFGHKISEKLYKSYITRKYDFHIQSNSSKIINNLQNEITSFSINVLLSVIEIGTEILIFTGLIFLLIFIDPIGCLVLAFTSIGFIYLFRKITKEKTYKWASERQKMDRLAIQQIQQGIGGIREVIIMLKEKIFVNYFSHFMKKSSIVGAKSQSLIDIPRYYMEFLALNLFVLLIFISVIREVELINIIPTLSVFTAVAFKLLPAVNRISSSFVRLGYSKVIVDTIYTEIQYFNKEGEILFNKVNNNFKSLNFEKNIILKNIFFQYPGSEKIVLNNINLNIAKGEIIGIVGESGEGKTTLVNIIIGLLKPDSGNIFLDSKNIHENQRGWRSIIGYIPQNPFMLDDTIYNNVTFEPNNEKISIEKFNKCIKEAQLFDFVNSLNDKHKTLIGERGARLSGGQLQRLAIARALFKNPKILILDEATSSLDLENEEKIMKTINKIKEDKTIIIISHKASALNFCNRILRLKNGILENKI